MSEQREYPFVRAAFINAIADEGSKEEAVTWLQKTWDELCSVRTELAAEKETREKAEDGWNTAFQAAMGHQNRADDLSAKLEAAKEALVFVRDDFYSGKEAKRIAGETLATLEGET